MVIGVLALQGGFAEHIEVLSQLGVETRRVRVPQDLEGIEGLVIPGGESSVIDKLARALGLAAPLSQAIEEGLPVFATCAGLIYLGQVENPAPGQRSLDAWTQLCGEMLLAGRPTPLIPEYAYLSR